MRKLLQKKGLVDSADFMDSIESDEPKGGAWSLIFNAPRNSVAIRSLKYPGYFFFHQVNTNCFGAAYFGSGLPEADIVFML